MRFEKWEGLGNDFIVTDRPPSADLARRLCDRHFGIGADGVLFVEGASSARPRMVVHNADGSRPEMCGNGVRCVVGFAADPAREAAEITVATDAGDKRCSLVRKSADEVVVTVAMGIAKKAADLVVVVHGAEHRFTGVDVGNPHAITFEPYDQAAIDRVGPIVATSPREGTNVEFCRVEMRGSLPMIVVTVWERGVGRTLACGTGACAVAFAACERGLAPWGAPIRVALPGGELEITVDAETHALSMRGPARRVFRGEVVLP
jgi:diaminopimelate epimerase